MRGSVLWLCLADAHSCRRSFLPTHIDRWIPGSRHACELALFADLNVANASGVEQHHRRGDRPAVAPEIRVPGDRVGGEIAGVGVHDISAG